MNTQRKIMIDISNTNGVLTVRLPRTWRAEYAHDFTIVEKEVDRDAITRLRLDLSKVATINPATLWLIDQIHWKCVTSRKSFDIVASSRIVEMYFSTLSGSMG